MTVREPRYKSDHIMVIGCLNGAYLREYSRYFGRRTCFLLQPSNRKTRKWVEKIFAELRHAVPKPDKQAACHNSWILAETWRLVDEKVSARWEPGRDERRLRRMVRDIG